jgi:murein DD-endopeptidase MepM/ murein hydrolase activator NlpD
VKGDTLSAIAKAYGISQKTLAEANGITNPDMIRVNQLLNIPQANTASSSDHASLASQAPAVPNLIAMAPKSAKESGIPVINASTNSDVPQASGLGISFQRAAKPAFQAKIASLPSESTSVNGQAEDTVSPATADSSVQNNQVATAPLIDRQSTQSGETTSDHRYNYVENLRLEIVKLREKYKHAAIQPTVSSQPEARVATVSLTPGSVPSSETASGPVNPELSSSKYAESVRSQVHKLQARAAITREVSTSAASLNSASQPQSQLVATSSIGSENYEPLLPSSLGKMVSPDLPPLGSVDSYLPGAAGKFKGYIWPAKGLLTSGYGWRWGRMHKGIDVAAPIGTPVMAAASGVVITAGWNSGGYGNMVEIQHPDGSVTLYAHNNRILVREGQQVEQGQQIAEMGSTGYSTGPHCHFEVHLPGHGAVNPIAYLPRAGA